MKIEIDKLNEIQTLLTNINKNVYKNKYLLSNQILNKNIFNIYYDNNWEFKKKGLVVFIKLPFYVLWYYIKSFVNLFLFFVEILLYKLSGQNVNTLDIKKNSIFIDCFCKYRRL